MQIEMIRTEALVPYAQNARTHSSKQVKQIIASIQEFGWTNPVLIDEGNGIIAGHGRTMAAQEIGMPEIPCIRLSHLTEAQKRAYILADNQLAMNAGWNEELLAVELDTLRDLDFDIPLIGFEQQYVNDLIGTPNLPSASSCQGVFAKDKIIDEAFAYFRAAGFPYRNVAVHVAMQQINKLAATATEDLMASDGCYQIADTYHKHRFAATVAGKRSPIESFAIDKSLRHALELELDSDSTIGTSLTGSMLMVYSTQACANFRPAFALRYYREFCGPDSVVLDTSHGYGGRLVGFMASGAARYIGIDPNTETSCANRTMAEALGFADRIELINKPAEDVAHDVLKNRCDFSFTSPPYFSKEHYSQADTQSWVRYGDDFERWCAEFLAKMLELQYVALKPGSYSVVNVADVSIKDKRYPIEQATVLNAERAGFMLERTDKYPLTVRFGANQSNEPAYEPVFVFKKPG